MDLTKMSVESLENLKVDNIDQMGVIKAYLKDGLSNTELTEDVVNAKEIEIKALVDLNKEIDDVIGKRLNNITKQTKESGENMKNKAYGVLKAYFEGATKENGYVLTADVTDTFTTEGNTIILEDEKIVKTEHETVKDLRKFVNTVKVSVPSGKTVTSSRKRQGLSAKTELGTFPILKGLLNNERDFKTAPKGGEFTVSYELIRDSAFDIEKFFNNELNAEKLVTYNTDILTAWDTLTAVEVTDADVLKTTVQAGIPLKYKKPNLIINRSAQILLSTQKYVDGRYIFGEDASKPDSGYVFGKYCEVVDDADLGGVDGVPLGYLVSEDAVDLYDYEAFSIENFDKSKLGTKFALYMQYGVAVVNNDAGIKLTFNFEEPVVEPEV